MLTRDVSTIDPICRFCRYNMKAEYSDSMTLRLEERIHSRENHLTGLDWFAKRNLGDSRIMFSQLQGSERVQMEVGLKR
jgi:hypothetical protein